MAQNVLDSIKNYLVLTLGDRTCNSVTLRKTVLESVCGPTEHLIHSDIEINTVNRYLMKKRSVVCERPEVFMEQRGTIDKMF